MHALLTLRASTDFPATRRQRLDTLQARPRDLLQGDAAGAGIRVADHVDRCTADQRRNFGGALEASDASDATDDIDATDAAVAAVAAATAVAATL